MQKAFDIDGHRLSRPWVDLLAHLDQAISYARTSTYQNELRPLPSLPTTSLWVGRVRRDSQIMGSPDHPPQSANNLRPHHFNNEPNEPFSDDRKKSRTLGIEIIGSLSRFHFCLAHMGRNNNENRIGFISLAIYKRMIILTKTRVVVVQGGWWWVYSWPFLTFLLMRDL